MKKKIFIVLFISISTISLAQINEIGFFVGNANYVGDIGRTNYLYPSKPAGGIIYKWNWNPRIAVRGTYSYLPIGANDLDSKNAIRKSRGYKFTNIIHELAVGIEFNFFEYDLSSRNKFFTPYILLEFAAFNYQTPQSVTSVGGVVYTDKTSYAIPFGIGYKARLMYHLAFAIEAKARYTFEDDLDYSTSRFPSLNFGGKGNDWYFFTGVSLVYTFGRPACYADPK